MLVLRSVPCESFCTESCKSNEWPTFALLQEKPPTEFPSIGEASARFVCELDISPKVFTPARIAARVKVRASSLADTGPMFRATICGFSIVARFFATIA